jgi:CRISPR-associated endonuclease/helicase Cas3
MENRALAKTEKEKTIKEHTEDLLRQYDILKSIYPNILTEEEWGLLREAVIYHDLGKINSKFQNKLYKVLGYKKFLPEYDKREEIPHNFLSPLFINTEKYCRAVGESNTKILISSVYYHHNREEKRIQQEDIEDVKQQSEFLNMNVEVNPYSRKYVLSNDDEDDIKLLESRKYILIKGLLNKLDYVASIDRAGVNVEENSKDNNMTVADKVKNITEEKFDGKYREVQRYMMNNGDKNLIVISYTGSGKTEAALLWISNQKAFYTLPLKVSINAMYKRISQNIGYQKALLLHSDAYSFYKNEQNDLNQFYRAKRMSSPIIVTTVDQIFKIVFRYQGYEEILATLSYSKVVIDEIQMYSPELLAYILLGLKMITDIGGKFAIITATFPPVLYDFMNYLKIPYRKQEERFMPHITNRHKIKLIEQKDFDFEKIKILAQNKKILIIVNTIRRAQEIYEKLEDEHAHLLHSQYIREDRDKLEEAILKFGNREENRECGIWISTQIVEASLDIDFDILFTEMCSIDSLWQRMGRVYRKRVYKEERPNVYILDNRNGVPYIIDSEIYDYTLDEIKKFDNKNISEADKQDMIENIFSIKKNPSLRKSKYYKKIKDTIQLLENIRPYDVENENVNNKFRNIQNVSLIPDNIYQQLENGGLIDEWNTILKSSTSSVSEKMQVKDKISKYIISVRWSFKLEKDAEELFYKGSNIYRTRYQYDFDKEKQKGKGLIMKNMQNRGYFDE